MRRALFVVLVAACFQCSSTKAPPDEETGTRYDFIVVGGGTAGCVVAGRLAENPSFRILILEAGKEPTPDTWVPSKYLSTLLEQGVFYSGEPQASASNRSLLHPAGRALGGSATVNTQGLVRGPRQDYDAWDKMLGGGSGWNADEAVKYFKKAEYYDGPADPARSADSTHPIFVTEIPYKHPLHVSFRDAAIASGLPALPDYNASFGEGVGYLQVNTRQGRRETTCDAYVTAARAAGKIEVRTQARVDRITFDAGAGVPIATGVEFVAVGADGEPANEKAVLSAGGEVLVAAGAYNSPKLLLLSGIGDEADLKANDVPLVKNLPGVGRNLQDHAMFHLAFATKNSVTSGNESHSLAFEQITRDPAKVTEFESLLKEGKGPFASSGFAVSLFLESPFANDLHPIKESPDAVPPDLEVWLGAIPPENIPLPPDLEADALPFLVPLIHNIPDDRSGTIRLRSKDPGALPLVDVSLMSSAVELDALVWGVKQVRALMGKMTYPGTNVPLVYREIAPGKDVDTDDALRAWGRDHVIPGMHVVGTCKMGTDPLAVVDTRLRVHGTKGVRVVDASVMPYIPRANTMFPIIMVAEKAADLIKDDHATGK